MVIIWLAVNQNQVGLDMTIAMVTPITHEGMIKFAGWQGFVGDKQFEDFSQDGIEYFAVPPCFSRL